MKSIKKEIFTSSNIKNTETNFKVEIVWFNSIIFALVHIGAVYGFYLIFTSSKLSTNIFCKNSF